MKAKSLLTILFGLLALCSSTLGASAHGNDRPGRAVLDVASTLVPSGVTTYALVSAQNKVFWHTVRPQCPPIPAGPLAPADVAERISRVATYGSIPRVLYEQAGCGASQFQSNIVADDDYVYWTGPGGLMRLSVLANPGDMPEQVCGALAGRAELAIDGTNIFALHYDNSNTGLLYQVPKATGICAFVVSTFSTNTRNLQTSYSSIASVQRYFVYWLDGTNLIRYNLDTAGSSTIATGVTGYYAEGGRAGCCFFSDLVFYGTGNTAGRYNNLTDKQLGTIYTSIDPSASVFSLTTDDNNAFFLERRDASCLPLTCYEYVIVRSGRSNDNNQVPIYNTGALTGFLGAEHLTTNGTFLFWQEDQTTALLTLPNDASALPQTNMWITGLEVTQGIQSLNNDVFLIKNRRTFVRVYVGSEPAGACCVTAHLSATWNGGGSVLPLLPANPAGTRLSIGPPFNRENINASFLFDLPLEWTTQTNLALRAEINPYHNPLQTDYSGNVMQSAPLNFVDSPRLSVNLVQFQYPLSNTVFTAPMTDTLQAVSLVRRMYPLASTPGWYSETSPGFRPRLWTLFDAGLGSRVNFTASECNAFLSTDQNNNVIDKRNLCPTEYANNRLKAYRSEQGLPNNAFMYGLIRPAPGFGLRGQAFSGDFVASGASNSAGTGAHEIGHTLGRDHPFKGSKDDDNVCGNTPDDGAYDMNYPYADSSIGPPNGSYEGFDPGDASLKITPTAKPSKQWFDIMGYCGPQWISDYTYGAMYIFALTHTPVLLSKPAAPRVNGDFLNALGVIAAGGGQGSFSYVRRLGSLANTLPITPGGYSLRLRNAQGTTLADYAFTPEEIHHGGGVMEFGLTVPFASGTREIQLIKLPSQVIATRPVSANAPSVSNVALAGAPNPVTGTVTLGWTASDPDGDALSFDILYSRDGGSTFQPVRFGVSGSSAPIDTSRLGGGTAIFRVIATDGVLTAQADSAPFTMANHPPTPHIYSPGDGTRIQWGQLLHFSGDADDPQDGSLSGRALQWQDQLGNTLASGTEFSNTNLRVGVNRITLTATDSASLSASTTITVFVDDDLRLPGPILSVGPTAVNWAVAPGTSAPQTAQVFIANAGGGTLSWTASSDQGWLSLSASSGSVPFTLTLSADLTGMTDGMTRSASVAITKPASGNEPAQSISVPVQVSMGNVEDAPVRVLDRRVYLPLIEK